MRLTKVPAMGAGGRKEIRMNNFSKVETIYEFTNKDSGNTNGVYRVTFKGCEYVFVRNGNSIGKVSHYLGEPASRCVGEIRDDVKQEFLAQLAMQRITGECAGCENWSGSDCTLVAPDTGCPYEGPQEAGEEQE
ncbi:hypothetical protein KL86CLO1_11657 [uncultured Eubacteriales bacterium]|uniref:Uncharacterized protein n=1 Tax=uncultured Eubacteriales bacterium TaxID=172733 RepID=A0A212JT65_9FIRM|nr:hypothetical protein KL86CLO1_11657 [uncultured Eubacteriales bacterium]